MKAPERNTEIHRKSESSAHFIANSRTRPLGHIFAKYNDSMRQTLSWLYHNTLKVYICGITLINEISPSANIWAVGVFTKPLLSRSAAATLILALIFWHLVYCIFPAGTHASVLPCSNFFMSFSLYAVCFPVPVRSFCSPELITRSKLIST